MLKPNLTDKEVEEIKADIAEEKKESDEYFSNLEAIWKKYEESKKDYEKKK